MGKLLNRNAASYYNELIQAIESEIGASLLPGDERRIFADALSYVFFGEDAVFNEAYNQFSPVSATGTYLDALGARVGVSRTSGNPAQICLTCYKNDPSDAFTIPAATAFSVNGLPWISSGSASTSPGSASFALVLESEGKGEENNSVTAAASISTGNEDWDKVSSFFVRYLSLAQADDTEDDDAFRVRVLFAYSQPALALTASAWLGELRTFAPSIVDAEVTGNQGTVSVYPLALDSEGLNKVPDASLTSTLETALNNSEKKPLGDVLVVTPPAPQHVSASLKVSVPFASLTLASSKKDAYLLEVCRRLSGNVLADYSQAVLLDTVLDVVSEATDVHFVSDTTPGLNNASPQKSLHLTGEVFIFSPAYISMTFEGV